MRSIAKLFALVGLSASALLTAAEPQRAYDILKNNCFACHGVNKMSGLDLRTRESILTGGTRGPAATPSNLKRSPLYQFVSHEAEPAMPPGKKLSDGDIEVLRQWILDGVDFTGVALPADLKTEDQKIDERAIRPEERKSWAFQKPQRIDPPKVSDAGWNRNPIDAFLRKTMADRKVKPSPVADRRTLIRRAYLDLLGLPPKPEEVEAFVANKAPDAWEYVVDGLLASPHYGERWARHWLDLVRFADSGGFEFDVDRPEAWRYRDYVVSAFNNDKRYDTFLKEQLAGDEYAPDSHEANIATGYLQLGPNSGGGERGRQDGLDDVISTTSAAFLGVTVGCARCHFHKFDPIPQKDYYQFQAVFASAKPVSYPLVSREEVAARDAAIKRIEELKKPLTKSLTEVEKPYRNKLVEEYVSRLPAYLQEAWRTPAENRTEGQRLNFTQIQKTLEDDTLANRITEQQIVAQMPADVKAQHAGIKDRIAELEAQKPKQLPTAMATGENSAQPRPSYFLRRGGIDALGPRMTPGVLSVVSETPYVFPTPPEGVKSTWQRRGFAEWVASPENPLTARVMVNRIWQHHFGEGIVRTPNNLGKMGEPPSHPELLDWLATEFVERGWSVKSMHKLLMTSQAYQMASDDVPAGVNADPENRLFWRMPRLRLEAEAIRDNIMAVAGTLDRTLGGPAIYPYINPALFQSSTKRTWPGKPEDDPSTWRRSLYVYSKRSIRYPMFEAYDQPNLVNSCERRNRSTIAPQALFLMNDTFIQEQSRRFADRLRKDAGEDAGAQVDRAFQLALGRAPRVQERATAVEYVKTSVEGLVGFSRAVFNLNEFIYRP